MPHLANLFIISIFFVFSVASFSIRLDPRLDLHWELDYEKKIVYFEATYEPQISEEDDDPKDWVAIGFTPSNEGELTNADFCLLWADWKDNVYIEDINTGSNDTIVSRDRYQDCENFRVLVGESSISWAYSRKFDTCHDSEDYVIEEGTTHIVWSYGKGPLYDVNGIDLTDSEISIANGFSRVRLLKVDTPVNAPDDTKILEVRHQVTIPSDNTTYWCSVHKLPEIFSRKHHVIKYEPVIAPGNDRFIHHMEVFHCIPPTDSPEDKAFPIWQGPCGSDEAPEKLQRCKKVLAAWAIGAGPFIYPEEAGLAMGGPDFDPYIMLEVHLNNEQEEAGVRDSSGLRFFVTEFLRPHDAGIMELGLIYTDRMAIPPGQYMFPLDGYCLPACTAVGLPSEGMTIFGSQLHTHATGLRVATRHFRNGIELPEVNRDNHYSTHFQEIRALREPRKILPGDELVTTCWFDTTWKSNVTLGGFTFNDEMCLNYIHYYPRTEDLEICKSAVDSNALDTYFGFLKEWDGQDTDPLGMSVAENYRSISWTKLRSEKLKRFYNYAPVEMQCSSGGGAPLPGKWTDMKVPQIKEILLPEPRPTCQLEDAPNYISVDTLGIDLKKRPDDEKRRKRGFEKKKKRFSADDIEKRFALRRKRQDEEVKRRKRDEPSFVHEKRFAKRWSDLEKRFAKRSEKRSNVKKKSEILLELIKRAGMPFNEMKKKKSGQSFNEMKKKSGQSFNEMKKSSMDNEKIAALEDELDRASALLDELSPDSDISAVRRRKRLFAKTVGETPEETIQNLERQVEEVHELLQKFGIGLSDIQDFDEDELINKRRKKLLDQQDDETNERRRKRDFDDEFLDYIDAHMNSNSDDGSDTWSDYEWWGLDKRRRKRGLGSMKKKKRSRADFII